MQCSHAVQRCSHLQLVACPPLHARAPGAMPPPSMPCHANPSHRQHSVVLGDCHRRAGRARPQLGHQVRGGQGSTGGGRGRKQGTGITESGGRSAPHREWREICTTQHAHIACTTHQTPCTMLHPTGPNHTTLRGPNHTTLRGPNHTTLRGPNHTTLRGPNHTTLRAHNPPSPCVTHLSLGTLPCCGACCLAVAPAVLLWRLQSCCGLPCLPCMPCIYPS